MVHETEEIQVPQGVEGSQTGRRAVVGSSKIVVEIQVANSSHRPGMDREKHRDLLRQFTNRLQQRFQGFRLVYVRRTMQGKHGIGENMFAVLYAKLLQHSRLRSNRT